MSILDDDHEFVRRKAKLLRSDSLRFFHTLLVRLKKLEFFPLDPDFYEGKLPMHSLETYEKALQEIETIEIKIDDYFSLGGPLFDTEAVKEESEMEVIYERLREDTHSFFQEFIGLMIEILVIDYEILEESLEIRMRPINFCTIQTKLEQKKKCLEKYLLLRKQFFMFRREWQVVLSKEECQSE